MFWVLFCDFCTIVLLYYIGIHRLLDRLVCGILWKVVVFLVFFLLLLWNLFDVLSRYLWKRLLLVGLFLVNDSFRLVLKCPLQIILSRNLNLVAIRKVKRRFVSCNCEVSSIFFCLLVLIEQPILLLWSFRLSL